MIYFLRAGDTEFVKIGYAVNVADRVAALQAGNHLPLRVFRTIEGGLQQEAWLHDLFRAHRVEREWFRYHPDMESATPPAPDTTLFRGLLDMLRPLSTLAAEIGEPEVNVRAWHRLNSIPAHAFCRIIKVCEKRGIPGVDAAALCEMAEERRAA